MTVNALTGLFII
jgi:hypothetical protein